MALATVYICDANPRMRQLIAERLEGHAEVVGAGGTAQEAIEAAASPSPDVIVLDYRTTAGNLAETVAAVKDGHPSVAVVVHTGVPRALIGDEVEAAGGVYSPKNEPEHLVALVRSARPAAREAASRDS
jgi:DNA-binding NarL/FixJ family response regulator